MVDRPRVLAGILYSGEPTLSRAIDALEAQQDIDLRIVLFGGFDQWEAHRRLYRTFNETGNDVDMFVKVDADMVILHERLLAVLHAFLSDHEQLDRITVGVHDWLADAPIPGMHVWRSSVRWLEDPPALQTDLARNTVRAKLSYIDSPERLVLHAPDPTDVQAARYAARRTLKATARPNSRWEWARLEGLLSRALEDPQPARRIAAAAIRITFDHPDRMQRFVMEQGQVEEIISWIRRSSADWPNVADEALEHVRECARKAEENNELQAPNMSQPANMSRLGRFGLLLRGPFRAFSQRRGADVTRSLPSEQELAAMLTTMLDFGERSQDSPNCGRD